MDTSLRVVLLMIGLLIVAGIFWDMFRFKHLRSNLKLPKHKGWFSSKKHKPALETPLIELTSDDVIVLTVMARKPGVFLGKKLREAFSEAHLHYGDLEIFHQYENSDGSGKQLFSVASAVEPGIFDLSTMDTFTTPGLSLFFSPERRNQSIAAFESMLRTAKLLAQRLGGELKDQDYRPLTLSSIEKYRARVRLPHAEKVINSF